MVTVIAVTTREMFHRDDKIHRGDHLRDIYCAMKSRAKCRSTRVSVNLIQLY